MSYNCHNCQSAVKPEIETGPLKHTCILLFDHERSSGSHYSWMVIRSIWFKLTCISVRVFEQMLPQHNTVILVVVQLGHIGNHNFCIEVGCHLRHWYYFQRFSILYVHSQLYGNPPTLRYLCVPFPRLSKVHIPVHFKIFEHCEKVHFFII